MSTQKRCTQCGELKPPDEFFRARLGRDGLAAECKSCHRARADLKNRPRERTEAKRLGLPRYFTGRPCNRGHIAERYTSGGCVECLKEDQGRYPEDPNHKKQRKKRWDNENVDHRRAYYERTREHQSEYHRQHRLLDPDKERERHRRYRHRKQMEYRFYNADRRIRKRRPKWADQDAIKAVYLACPPGMVVDHIVPLNGITSEGYKVSGLHVAWNLQYLSQPVNGKKNRRMRPEDHLIAGG